MPMPWSVIADADAAPRRLATARASRILPTAAAVCYRLARAGSLTACCPGRITSVNEQRLFTVQFDDGELCDDVEEASSAPSG